MLLICLVTPHQNLPSFWRILISARIIKRDGQRHSPFSLLVHNAGYKVRCSKFNGGGGGDVFAILNEGHEEIFLWTQCQVRNLRSRNWFAIRIYIQMIYVDWRAVHNTNDNKFDVCLSMHRCICVEKKNQLDVTECFIAFMLCSTCFGHFYALHQELETICVLLPPMVCSAWLLVVGGQVQGSRLCVQEEGCCSTRVQ